MWRLGCAALRAGAGRGCAQRVEGMFGGEGANFRIDTADGPGHIGDDQSPRATHGLEHQLGIERTQAAQVDDFAIDAPLGEFVGGMNRLDRKSVV